MLMNQLLNKYLGYEYAATRMTSYSKPSHLRDYCGFVPSIAPSLTRNERITQVAARTYSRGTVITNTPSNGASEVSTQREYHRCGICSGFMHKHPIKEITNDNTGEVLTRACDRKPNSHGKHPADYIQYGFPKLSWEGRVLHDYNAYVLPVEDFSGPSANDYTREREWDSIYKNSDHNTEFYWQDNDPKQCTSAYGETWSMTRAEKELLDSMQVVLSAYEPQTRNYFIEGFDGFHTQEVYDEFITRKAHAKHLNVYVKDGKLRVGGLVVIPEIKYAQRTTLKGKIVNSDKVEYVKVTAYCHHQGCLKKPDGTWRKDERGNILKAVSFGIEGTELTREQMEDFIYALIRHGNNHASPWFTTRKVAEERRPLYDSHLLKNGKVEQAVVLPYGRWTLTKPERSTYYKVHDVSCDLDNCDPSKAYCNSQLTAAS